MKFELNLTNAQPTGAPAIATREANVINSDLSLDEGRDARFAFHAEVA